MLVTDRLNPHTSSMVAISGTTYATRATTAATRSYATFRNSIDPCLVDIGGQSDLLAGLTAAQILAAMEDYHADARAVGATRTLTCTVPSMTAAPWNYTAAMETERLALNPLILASTVFTTVADIAALPHAADPADTTYFSDGLHPTAVLAAEMADLIETRLASIDVL